MPRRRTRLVTNLALLLGATIAAVATLEIFLRLFPQVLPEETRLRLHWAQLVREPTVSHADSFVGFVYPARYHGAFDRGDAPFSYSTDEYGFRNPVGWPDTAAVVILGDSQAFGFGVDDGEQWPHLLEENLRSSVVNLGLIGAAPQQYTRVLQRYGLALSPQLVVYCLFPGNDLVDAGLFTSWEAHGSPGNYATWRFYKGERPDASDPVAGFVAQSRILALVRSARRRVTSQLTGHTIETADGQQLVLAPSAYRSSVALARPSSPEFEQVMESVERAESLAHGAGSDFLVVLVPTKEEVYLPLVRAPVPPLVEPLVRALAERGIETLDLTPALRKAARNGPALFFPVDGHPNEYGSRVIADLVFRRVSRMVDRSASSLHDSE
ncbi:MAG: alginate O-acetyltransferase AlgX-related protein [Gemmatimonadota bacterium]